MSDDQLHTCASGAQQRTTPSGLGIALGLFFMFVAILTLVGCFFWFGADVLLWLGIDDVQVVGLILGFAFCAMLAALGMVLVHFGGETQAARLPSGQVGGDPSPYIGKVDGEAKAGDTLYWKDGRLVTASRYHQLCEQEAERQAAQDATTALEKKKPYDDDLTEECTAYHDAQTRLQHLDGQRHGTVIDAQRSGEIVYSDEHSPFIADTRDSWQPEATWPPGEDEPSEVPAQGLR